MDQTQIEDWREDITEPKDTLRIVDKEIVTIAFLDDGVKKTSVDYGSSVVFRVKKIGTEEELRWYVNANNYDLLGQIKALGKPLFGRVVNVRREGSKRSDTRYYITKEINLD